jgi:hypothetical protein
LADSAEVRCDLGLRGDRESSSESLSKQIRIRTSTRINEVAAARRPHAQFRRGDEAASRRHEAVASDDAG